ncbi:transketolase [Micromonospora costi]|uniref:Transketolase n=1 Tax=Micromonospora costi TaxID=1530042 RepID=A0A3A9ZYW6_9ACTN|nr:transketolase [Micromonospora costi]
MEPAQNSVPWSELDDRAVATARVLAMDAVERAGHGHPGTAMSLAPVAHLLFREFLRHDPAHPEWTGRDRFVLSCGHSSLTLYTQLFLCGYPLTLDDLKNYRVLDSRTPAHPERGHTVGVETTTGPLGQGLATAVGIAMGARRERGLFHPDAPASESPFDYRVFVLCSDGDIQEGVTAEASSLAGHQRLGNLVVIYDDNRISIEGDTDLAFSEDVCARYESYGWHVQRVDLGPGGDVSLDDLREALREATRQDAQPSFIAVRTTIAWPAPNARNTSKSHGSALGAAEVRATKQLLGFDPDTEFAVDPEILAHTRQQAAARGAVLYRSWLQRDESWRARQPAEAALLDRIDHGDVPAELGDVMPAFPSGTPLSTRKAFGRCINAAAEVLPELWGGSADLGDSNNTTISSASSFLPWSSAGSDPAGRNIHFGIREHAMAATMNGIALSGRTRIYGGTFLVFSDYMRPAVRLAAIMGLPTLYVWTHDSIGLGEDGPTHQPIEHLANLRALPGLDVLRPADANETAVVLRTFLETARRPAGLCLSRQDVPTFPRGEAGFASAEGAVRGGYVLWEADDTDGLPDVILIGTGSEVQLAVDAGRELAADGVRARVVSMPCHEWFARQPQDYRDQVLPPAVRARVSVEAALGQGWRDYVGDRGRIVSIEGYGASGSATALYERFDVTAEAVVTAARESLSSLREAMPLSC